METDNEQTKSILQGMEMVYSELLEALKKEGLELFESSRGTVRSAFSSSSNASRGFEF